MINARKIYIGELLKGPLRKSSHNRDFQCFLIVVWIVLKAPFHLDIVFDDGN